MRREKKPLPKISKDDPVLIALNKMAEALDPFDRKTQLKILVSACLHFGMTDHARQFIDAIENGEKKQ
jgi:hypothetical protein